MSICLRWVCKPINTDETYNNFLRVLLIVKLTAAYRYVMLMGCTEQLEVACHKVAG